MFKRISVLFFFIFAFFIVNSKSLNVQQDFPMADFELRSSGIGGDHSTYQLYQNCCPIDTYVIMFLYFNTSGTKMYQHVFLCFNLIRFRMVFEREIFEIGSNPSIIVPQAFCPTFRYRESNLVPLS